MERFNSHSQTIKYLHHPKRKRWTQNIVKPTTSKRLKTPVSAGFLCIYPSKKTTPQLFCTSVISEASSAKTTCPMCPQDYTRHTNVFNAKALRKQTRWSQVKQLVNLSWSFIHLFQTYHTTFAHFRVLFPLSDIHRIISEMNLTNLPGTSIFNISQP